MFRSKDQVTPNIFDCVLPLVLPNTGLLSERSPVFVPITEPVTSMMPCFTCRISSEVVDVRVSE